MKPFPGTLQMQWVLRPFVTKSGRAGCQRVRAWVLTEEQEEWLRRWYPVTENPRLMKASGMSHSTLHRFARTMGLVKSEQGLRGIKRRQAAHIKRVCERNGYYDSLRGRQPSEACRQATARMWQDIREGRREHPFAIMRREHPRRYKKYMQAKSEERKATIRRERARMLFGLERKTRLRAVVMTKYTRSQVCHRRRLLRRLRPPLHHLLRQRHTTLPHLREKPCDGWVQNRGLGRLTAAAHRDLQSRCYEYKDL